MNYVKRYRMEISLRNWHREPVELAAGYTFVPWHQDLVEAHADTKFRSFRGELDSSVFPCLGDPVGCRRLMEDIASRMGFCREATWLARWSSPDGLESDYCGTIQGVRDGYDVGGVQNLGISPEHRGRGLGTALMLQSLDGFWVAGVRRVFLEVTALNQGALRLYQRLGFRCTKTVYKAVDSPIGESMQDHAVQDHAMPDQAMQNQAMQNQAMQNQAMQNQAMQNQAELLTG